MDEQRQRSGKGRRRRRKAPPKARPAAEPVLIAARRPNAPRIASAAEQRATAASAVPARIKPAPEPKPARVAEAPAKRTARIVQFAPTSADEIEQQRRKLLARLMTSDGRSAISRAAEEYRRAGFDFPAEQDVQLQLLEHFDEDQARSAIATLGELLTREPPIKKPVFEQRLRRLEEYADEPATRAAAAELRRAIRA